jgi:hypothetical protein
MGKIILSGLIAGVVVFMWGAASHMLLGLGEVGIKTLPTEEPVLSSLSSNVSEEGFYFFPGIKASERSDEEKQKAWAEKIASGPSGIMIYKPRGGEAMSPAQLIREFVANTAWCLIAAGLLSIAAPRIPLFLGRVLFVAAIGLIGGLDIYISYWNWYGFPGNYTAAMMLDQVIGFSLAGVVMAFFIKPRSEASGVGTVAPSA